MRFFDYYLQHKDAIEALLIDIDGTLVLSSHQIGEADKFIDMLHHDKKPFFLLTNDGNHSIKEKCQFMKNANLDIHESEIISCGSVLNLLAEENNFVGKKFFVLGELGNPSYASEAGFVVTQDIDEIMECEGVIAGEGDYDWRPNLEAVLSYFIKFPERPYIVPNPDSFWPYKTHGQFGIGAGGQARMIVNIMQELNFDFEPIYLGKPYNGIYRYALEMLTKKFRSDLRELNPEKIYAIGDSLSSDIAGANQANLNSVLVLSGITNSRHVASVSSQIKTPNFVFDSLA